MPTSPLLRRRARPVAGLLVLSLVLAACGSDDGDDTTTATDETTTTVDGTTTSDGDGVGPGVAAEVNLQLADLPEGWVAGPTAEDDDDDVLGECLGLDLDEIEERQVDEADSPEFSNPEALKQTVSSGTSIYDDEEVPAEIFDRLRAEETIPCLRAAFEERFTSDEELEGVDVRFEEIVFVDDFPTFGDESLLLTIAIVLSAESQEFSAHLDFVFLRTAEVASFVYALNLGEPTDPGLVTDLADAVAARQAASV
ncbi:MAG TPA: hypothetical protein VMN58_00330 [Acidimicrobiales bacterium]|nr:hypothetical protein [Acidimicrobiales bacterium]